MRVGSLWERIVETRVIVSGSAFVVLCWRRDATTVIFLLGAIFNGISSKVLKRFINASRPAGAQLSDPGMPSSHAQSLFFFAAYLAAATMHWPLPQLLVACVPSAPAHRTALATSLVLVAGGLTYLRVRAGLHTVAQVGVGALLGGAAGMLWFFHSAPILEDALGQLSTAPPLLAAICIVGLLVVGSAERVFGSRLKSH